MDIGTIGLVLIFFSICLSVFYILWWVVFVFSLRVKTLIVDDEEGKIFQMVSRYKFFLRPRVVDKEIWIDELLADTYTFVITVFPEVVFHVNEFYRKTTIVFFFATEGQDEEAQYKATLEADAVLREPIGKGELMRLFLKFFS